MSNDIIWSTIKESTYVDKENDYTLKSEGVESPEILNEIYPEKLGFGN